jgi:hypothetical protein
MRPMRETSMDRERLMTDPLNTLQALTDEEIDREWEVWLTKKYGAVTQAEGRVFARIIERIVQGRVEAFLIEQMKREAVPVAYRQWSSKWHAWDYQTERGDLRTDEPVEPLYTTSQPHPEAQASDRGEPIQPEPEGQSEGHSVAGASSAASTAEPLSLNFEFESLPPLDGMDQIYTEYAKTFGRYPDAFMAQVVRQTKEDLFIWWASHRELIREAFIAAEGAGVQGLTSRRSAAGASPQDEHPESAAQSKVLTDSEIEKIAVEHGDSVYKVGPALVAVEFTPEQFRAAVRAILARAGIGESHRQPLTREQIGAIVREASRGAATRRDGSTSTRIARAVEALHGIGTPEAGKELSHDQ